MKILCYYKDPIRFYGLMGEHTDMKDYYGDNINVGDIVKIISTNGHVVNDNFCVHWNPRVASFGGDEEIGIYGCLSLKKDNFLTFDETLEDPENILCDYYGNHPKRDLLYMQDANVDLYDYRFSDEQYENKWICLILKKWHKVEVGTELNKISVMDITEDDHQEVFDKVVSEYKLI